MMNRLLTDEEILKASEVEMFDSEGNAYLGQGYLTGRKQVAKAQDAKTRVADCKEFGEWLQDQVVRGFITAYPHDIREVVDTFLRGEMPGKENNG